MTIYGNRTAVRIDEVVSACKSHGSSSIIALSGVPATGKSYVSYVAAQEHAGEPTRVEEIQFHPSYTYEEFVEGLKLSAGGGVSSAEGSLLRWNTRALEDPDNQYVLLIEELTRANLSSVLGELLTYVEHRERSFTAMFSRKRINIATNLTILATYNPVDRSAISMDDALLRRLRIIDFPPDVDILDEMLKANHVSNDVIGVLRKIFEDCAKEAGPDFASLMPFGHGIFAEVQSESDLYPLWHQRLKWMLFRPMRDPAPLADVIAAGFPWKEDHAFRVSPPAP